MLALLGKKISFTSEASEDEDSMPLPHQCMSHDAMQKLFEMRLNNQLCDAVIRVDKDRSYNIHRAILCACSTYFSALFTTPLHSKEVIFDILGVTAHAIEWLIKFAYLRDISFIDDLNVYEIYVIADYFGVLGLMKACVEFIGRILLPANCIGLWLFSRYRCVSRLTEKAWNFILENFVSMAIESEELLQLNVDDFYAIINDELLNVKDEHVVWEALLKWIDCEPEKRLVHLPKIMGGVRLGLLANSYFMENVKSHPYVEDNPDVRPLILETMRFLCDLESLSTTSTEITTPPVALPRLPHEVIFAIGGWSEGAPQTCIETYDTRADRWIRVPQQFEDPSGPRSYHGTIVMATKLFLIGGFNGTEYFNTCTRFDAVKKSWKEIAPMHCRRCYVSVALLNGIIYALGGYDGQSRQSTGERYCPKTNQWSLIAPMHLQRSDADACSLDGKVYIVGGFNGQECLNSAEYYTPENNTWTLISSMISRRSGVSCVAHRSCIYVVGGFNGLSRMNTAEKYDPVSNTWTAIREMYNPRSNFGLEVIDDMVMAIGGFNGVVTISNCECYVLETNEWLEATDMSIIRSALTTSVVRGLPNVHDYIHKNRHKLIEEKRIRIIENNSSIMSPNVQSDIDEEGISLSVESIHRAGPLEEESEEAFTDDESV